MLYEIGFGGDIYAISIATGAILWQTNTNAISGPAGTDSPYGVWPIWAFGNQGARLTECVLGEGHEYSPPLFRGANEIAINITNGNPVWSMLGFDVDGGTAISDGVMLTESAYDNLIYAYGQGPSTTTVVTPDIGVTTATPITITGSVMDISAGSQQRSSCGKLPTWLTMRIRRSTAVHGSSLRAATNASSITGVPVTLYV